MDTFGDMTPIEAATPVTEVTGGEELDTFDNETPITELPKKDEDSQVKLLDEQEETKEKSDSKENEEESEEEEDSEEGEDPKEKLPEEKKEETKPKGKTIRVKDGDEAVDISEEATVKVKVKGKNEFVSIAELKKNFSGHQVWDEKIKEADRKLRDSEERSAQFEAQKNEIVEDLRQVVQKMDAEDGNPLDAMKYLLEITNRPVHTYMKRALEAQLDQLSELQEMSDVERELYWKNQEADWLRNNHATQSKRLQEKEAHREFTQRVESLRGQYGVSEEEYIEVQRELKLAGRDFTPEEIVQASLFKPVYAKSDEFVKTHFGEDLGDDDLQNLTAGTARVLFNNPKATEEEAVRLAARDLGYEVATIEDDIAELESKKSAKKVRYEDNSHLRYGKQLEDNELDTFDAFESL